MKANILIDKLPEVVQVEGREYEIACDFRTSVLFELLMNDPDYSDEEKIVYALDLYFGKNIPENAEEAVNAIVDFYACGEMESNTKDSGRKKHKKIYSFEQDAPYIYAAFMSQYRVNLNEIENLHWWAFSAMFCSLSENEKMSRIMYYRDVELKGKSKSERKFLESMKKKYALKENAKPHHQLLLAQRNAAMRDYVKKRFEEVKR